MARVALSSVELRLARGLVALLLCGAVAAQEPASPPAPGAADRIASSCDAEINRTLRRARLPKADPRALSSELATLGQEFVASAVRLLEVRRLPAIDAGAEQVLSDAQQSVLLLALRTRVREEVWAAANAAMNVPRGEAPTVAARVAAILAAGTVARAEELPRIAAFARAAGASELDPRIEQAMQIALEDMFRRDSRALDFLAERWRRLPEDLLPAIVRASGADGNPRALPFLAEMLERGGDVERLALAELSRQRAPKQLPPGLAEALCSRLETTEPQVCRAACSALAQLGVFDGVEPLIGLLSDPSAGIRASALQGLTKLSGLQLPAQPSGWKAWWVRELEWEAERAEPLREALASENPEEGLAALAEISQHRWERHAWSDAIGETLHCADLELVARAREVLAQLDSPRSQAALEELDARARSRARSDAAVDPADQPPH